MTWWNAFTRSWFLIGEHAEVDLRAARTVACKQCGQIYNRFSDGHVQANDMCAWSFQKPDGRWVVQGGYGSTVADLRELWYLKNYPSEPVDGICDFCIMRMIGDGTLIDSGYQFDMSGVVIE